MRWFDRGVSRFTDLLLVVAMVLMMGLMLLGTADVVGRYALNMPIKAAYPISELLLSGVVFFGLAYTRRVGGHVAIDSVVVRLPRPAQGVVGFLTSLMVFVIVGLIGWRSALLALRSWEGNIVAETIFIPIFPFQVFMPLGALAFCLEEVMQMIKFVRMAKGGI